MRRPVELPLPEPAAAEPWVVEHLGHLCGDEVRASPAFRGGQRAADSALADLDIAGYARRRSMVDPPVARGASRLSPYIRHGLLSLRSVWDRVVDAPGRDRFGYQGELLWQDYARHWYAVHATATRRPIAYEPVRATKEWSHDPWWRDMACVRKTLEELETDGWCVNQTRMWLASQFAVRGHGDWRLGEDEMFRHLLDGSRAANRLGWQWCIGATRPRAHGFAKPQVTKRAPAYCESCTLRENCPIGGYAKVATRTKIERPELLDSDAAFGPAEPTEVTGAHPEAVWVTAESLGTGDPALAAHPDLPVWFVFDEALPGRLRLSSKRLVFLTETLAELASNRHLILSLGDPSTVLADTPVATTFAPVPGFRRIADRLSSVELHPWPWLRPPTVAYRESLTETGRFPSFRDFCRLTKPTEPADQ